MRIVLPPDGERRHGTLVVDPERRPSRVRVPEQDRDVFLDWDQALDDEGHLRRCLLCGSGVYRRKSFPQVTGFVAVLALALALVGMLGFADDVPLLIGMSLVLLIDICILFFAGTHLICYGCRASFRSTPIAPWHRQWDRSEAAKHEEPDNEP